MSLHKNKLILCPECNFVWEMNIHGDKTRRKHCYFWAEMSKFRLRKERCPKCLGNTERTYVWHYG